MSEKTIKPAVLTMKNGMVISFQAGEWEASDEAQEMLEIIFDGWVPEGYTPSLDLAMAEEAQKWLGGEIGPYEIESEPGVIY
jgi:hypothetical protein